jgi:hypothetical protein
VVSRSFTKLWYPLSPYKWILRKKYDGPNIILVRKVFGIDLIANVGANVV